MAKKKGKGGGKDDKGKGKGKGKGDGSGKGKVKGKDAYVDVQPDAVKTEVRVMSPAAVEDLVVEFEDPGMGMLVANVTARVTLNPAFETMTAVPKVIVSGGMANLEVNLEDQGGNIWKKTGIGPGLFQSGVTYFFQVVASYEFRISDLKTSASKTQAAP